MPKGNKAKQNTSSTSTVTQVTEKTNEEKSETTKGDFGDMKLKRHLEKIEREEEERKKYAEEKAKQEKMNATKKKNKKSRASTQKTSEPKPEPKSTEEHIPTPVKVENTSGEWKVQDKMDESMIQSNVEEYTVDNTQFTEEPTSVQDSSDTPEPVQDTDFIDKSSDDFTSERPKQDWGKRQDSFQNPNNSDDPSWNESTNQTEKDVKPQTYENKTWRGGSNSNYDRTDQGKPYNPNHDNRNSRGNNFNQERNQYHKSEPKNPNYQSQDRYNKYENKKFNNRESGGSNQSYANSRYDGINDNRNSRGNNFNQGRNYYHKSEPKNPNSQSQDRFNKYENKKFNNRESGGSYQNYANSRYENDKEFQEFNELSKKRPPINHGKLSERKGDLFTASDDYSLAHCVAEDMSMGAGIAKTFRSKFGAVGQLLNQQQKTGGLAVLQHKDRFIYYLVTKQISRGKPTLYTLWCSLNKLKEHIQENNVTKLAIPQIGCGLDRLDWNTVKQMLEHVFQNVDIEIVVYIWDETVEEPTLQKLLKKCTVINAPMELLDINSGTGLIYFGTVDGYESDGFKTLSKKYNISGYKQPKTFGQVVKTRDKNEYIYGLIIKEKYGDQANFEGIEKGLKTLRTILRDEGANYIAFEAFIDNIDELLMDKIIAMMQYIFLDVEIWICWPDALKHLCPQQSRPYSY